MKRYREKNRDLIDDLCVGCCSPNKYCTLKEIMSRVPRDARTMVQIKCIEKLKYERSKAEHRDLGWDEAINIWIDEGYSDRFVNEYHEGVRLSALYSKIAHV